MLATVGSPQNNLLRQAEVAVQSPLWWGPQDAWLSLGNAQGEWKTVTQREGGERARRAGRKLELCEPV